MRHIRQLDDDSWFCPPTADVLNRAELENIDEYIHRRRDTVKNCEVEAVVSSMHTI